MYDNKKIAQYNDNSVFPNILVLFEYLKARGWVGLAQHYGLKTDVLDLTNSPLVAAFFATTEYDGVADAYRPGGVEAARGTEGIWD